MLSSEKQLLCMARAILKRSKVLFMDEVCRISICLVSQCHGFSWIIRRLLGLNISSFPLIRELINDSQCWLCNRWAHWQDHQTVRTMILLYVADYSILVSEFAESTILTIAHRLRTVIDYDRVSVLTILKPHTAKNHYKCRWWYLSKAELSSLIGMQGFCWWEN